MTFLENIYKWYLIFAYTFLIVLISGVLLGCEARVGFAGGNSCSQYIGISHLFLFTQNVLIYAVLYIPIGILAFIMLVVSSIDLLRSKRADTISQFLAAVTLGMPLIISFIWGVVLPLIR